MTQISLIIPSRDRLPLLQQLITNIKETSTNVEIIVVTDEDDHSTRYARLDATILCKERTEWLNRDYINWAYPYTSGKYIIPIHDDVRFLKKDWDKHAVDKLEKHLSTKSDRIIYGFTFADTTNSMCQFPLLSREAIDKLGFIMPNERKSTWLANQDLLNIFFSLDRILYLPEIEIEHITYRTNKRPKDHINIHVEDIFTRQGHTFVPSGFYANRLKSEIVKKEDTTKKEILVVYNICGIKGNENYQWYLTCINSILRQKNCSFRVVISGCLTSESVKKILYENLGDKVSYSWIDDKYPLNFTLNYTVQKCIEQFGSFTGVLYVDSGVTFQNDQFVIAKMNERLKQGYGIVSAKIDLDSGFADWRLNIQDGQDYILDIGRACNLHCQMFSFDFYKKYGKILPDCFAHDTSESTFSVLTAALHKKWVIAHDVSLHHKFCCDGASSGYRNIHDLLYRSKRTIQEICQIGRPLGFCYEEISNVCNHDPSVYDENGFPKNPNLLPFLKENLFCEYGKVNCYFSPEKEKKKHTINSPKLTCIVVSHEKPEFCNQALKSIIDQEGMEDYQVIVLDSGTLYNQGYFNWIKGDERFLVLPTNETPQLKKIKAMAPYCFNKAYKDNLIKGELVVYLCDDDIYYPNAFKTFVDHFENHPESMAVIGSQDVAVMDKNKTKIIAQRLTKHTIGASCREYLIICRVDYLQLCHRKSVMDKILWSEEFDQRNNDHKDGLFLNEIGKQWQIDYIPTKVSVNRRTPISTYAPM